LTGKEGLPVDAQAEAEFTEYMHHRWMRLVRLGYAVTGDRVLAEDIAQTALSRVYASWPKVRRADNPDAYVRTVVLNLCRDMRRRRRIAEVLTDAVPEPPSGWEGTDHRVTGEPELLAALMRLPSQQRRALVCRYWLDMRDADIAAYLGCAQGTVRSHISRAITTLRLNGELAKGAGNDG
jgi:RNA polymerase sigma-70 factor (sigma-E family)